MEWTVILVTCTGHIQILIYLVEINIYYDIYSAQ